MRFNWLLILGLAIIGLVRHLLDVLNILEMSGGLPSAIVTIFISVVWIGVVVGRQEPRPFRTLVAVGFAHGILLILLALVTPVIPTAPKGFVPPLGLVGILVFNVVWGLTLGLIAKFIQTVHLRGTSEHR